MLFRHDHFPLQAKFELSAQAASCVEEVGSVFMYEEDPVRLAAIVCDEYHYCYLDFFQL